MDTSIGVFLCHLLSLRFLLFIVFVTSSRLMNKDTHETLKECCFCNKPYKKLSNHYKSCPLRHGRDYHHLLSHIKTLSKKLPHKKSICPNCGKSFLRLDTHIRNSATCKSTYCITSSTSSAVSNNLPRVDHPHPLTSSSTPTQPTHPCQSYTACLSDSFVP